MVLRRAALFDHVPFPGHRRVKVRIGISPPPYLSALPVPSEHDIRVAIPINIIDRPACLDGQEIGFDHISGPAARVSAIPDHRRSHFAKT